ncbi:MAG: UDP-N-acetylmuramoylalanyl-D-glutamyl-2,6-diaminopimelate--D-alanyl-D-alanine ligase [Hoeflea sp.]|uniref:UDP-N-acetylmuramoylalanyl-D-glutamyl-2, 6-diaminopimelate--D-alanyl-D-alanine ligase n=1 Tax=Hoeflea sp. TaxID=1940281 RepID=UPI001E0B63B8|nr:UDP-N-acetylmuramoylalanyl-D-glutamyl-2,6-diaminopimelate--D-alanyl-D-alanine ligase [Hoeflea sp.]MBU4530002.1 UDP-N-acetylmuramoylalanyl-D-glutamyl-2,6-diaminopimelate--D-alanyl-D-alanine ligase [Alphaproteobacteria bacterium]MBU4543229.1 UDP-N-acetylmuramoylalanyl-D-glutamyl-2,6-diaminopimelate--D-alanyl-D-alanine ligase [Alphaproteobacteria bacterium]MBU4550231.1 UDP-N-acetylmuramoylalanyl-D-glutamyl-2,6-diaminopimelate--D-alanyl-D-alanine ligase [Alphaproteobacteria bacterium]MBV1722495.
MSLLWTAKEMIEAMDGRPLGTMPAGVSGISIDSRTVGDGEAFFAIKGDRFDGHNFASVAVANGASLLVVDESKLPAMGRVTAPMIVVNDVLAALEDLGRAARARSDARVIAITGSVGKTSTKEMLRRALEPSGEVHASTASFNNHWGVPLTLARMPVSAAYGVFEIGMNHPDEIRPLVKMVRPHVALITTIAAAHMGNFKNLGEIAAAKGEIMEGLDKDGHLLLNRDNEKYGWLKKHASELGLKHVHSFGENPKAEFRLLNCKLLPDCSTITARIGADDVAVKIGAPGRHLVQNALAVIGTVHLVGADLAKATHALAAISAEKGRGARHALKIDGGSFMLIDESYNANPASMRAALELLRDTPVRLRGRRVAVLGDMLEMGRFSERVHRDLAAPLREAKADLVCLAGPEMRALKDELGTEMETVYRDDADGLAAYLKTGLRDGDAVMVKSSLGIGFGRIVKALLDKYPALPDSSTQD